MAWNTIIETKPNGWAFSGIRVTRSLVLCVCFVDRCLSFCHFTFWSLCCLSLYLRILIIPFVSSNSSDFFHDQNRWTLENLQLQLAIPRTQINGFLGWSNVKLRPIRNRWWFNLSLVSSNTWFCEVNSPVPSTSVFDWTFYSVIFPAILLLNEKYCNFLTVIISQL